MLKILLQPDRVLLISKSTFKVKFLLSQEPTIIQLIYIFLVVTKL